MPEKFPILPVGENGGRHYAQLTARALIEEDVQINSRTERTILSSREVQGVFKAATGVLLPEVVLAAIGSDNIHHWELVSHPSSPSLLIIGGEKPQEGRFAIQDARATIYIQREIVPDIYRRVRVCSALLGGIYQRRIVEFSYNNPTYYDAEKKPEIMNLHHFGFSISLDEFPENVTYKVNQFEGGIIFYPGASHSYPPGYTTYPLANRWYYNPLPSPDPNCNHLYGAIITRKMREEILHGRLITTVDNIFSRNPNDRFYLGGGKHDGGDPAYQNGFYATNHGNSSVEFGKKDREKGVELWHIRLPLQMAKP